MAYLIISHNINILNYVTEKVLIMFDGRIVEIGKTEEVLENPTHPYTFSLIKSPKRGEHNISNFNIENIFKDNKTYKGCPYQFRCERVKKKCKEIKPFLKFFKFKITKQERQVACHYPYI